MLVICYINNDTQNQSQKTYVETTLNLDEWKSQNKNADVQFAFDATTDIERNQNAKQELFLQYCERYGLSPSDYGKTFFDRNGHEMKLVGLLPQNHKYKCHVHDMTANREYKMTPNHVIKLLETKTQKGDTNNGSMQCEI